MERTQNTPQTDLFLGRLPDRPYCTDDFSSGLLIRPAHTARRRKHIQVNPPWLRSFLVFDVDKANGQSAWYAAELPPPWWNAINRSNGHAHTCYALEAPVLLDGNGVREAPMKLLCAEEACIRELIGGDPAYGGLVTHNPEHPYWHVLTGGRPLTLTEIAEVLPDLNKHKPHRGRKIRVIGLGRNVDLFDGCRVYAYRAIRDWWAEGFVYWQAHLVAWCRDYTGNEHPRPLDDRESYHVARSIAKWTWRHITPERFSKRQAVRGKLGGAAKAKAIRTRNTERDAQIVERVAAGESMRSVARELGLAYGSVYTIVKRDAGRPA